MVVTFDCLKSFNSLIRHMFLNLDIEATFYPIEPF